MDTKTASAYSQTTTSEATEKEGVLIKGRDVIVLDAPEILPSPNTPLLTEAQDLVGAINELKKDLDGEGGDWQPPAEWLTVPEPADWEACFLVELTNPDKLEYQLEFSCPAPYPVDANYGTITFDWGDGTVETCVGGRIDKSGSLISEGENWWSKQRHTYAKVGQYVIKVTTDELNCRLQYAESSYPKALLIARLGKNISLISYQGAERSDNTFNGCSRLHWVEFNSDTELPHYCFSYCYALKKIDMTKPLTAIYDYCFAYVPAACISKIDFSEVTEIGRYAFNATRITKMYLPKCTKIGESAFDYCQNDFTEIIAPQCTSVGNYAFRYAYALEKAVFADGCTFGSNCFQNCYNLYPRPDGSTN